MKQVCLACGSEYVDHVAKCSGTLKRERLIEGELVTRHEPCGATQWCYPVEEPEALLAAAFSAASPPNEGDAKPSEGDGAPSGDPAPDDASKGSESPYSGRGGKRR